MSGGVKLIPDDTGAGRFLPWIVAVMVFLAALAVSGVLALDQGVRGWQAGFEGHLTVEVPAGRSADLDTHVAETLRVLRSTAGVRGAVALDDAEHAALLAPWFGPDKPVADLPIPRLVDVELDTDHQLDFDYLARRLDDAVPGARLDDHKVWVAQLIRLASGVQFIALATVVLIAGALAAVVVFAVRATLSVHHDSVALLHVMGARDAYIARQFQNHALWMGAKGGAAGLVLAALTLFVLSRLVARLEAPLLDQLSLGPVTLVVLAFVPVAGAGIAFFTARLTVFGALGRMP